MKKCRITDNKFCCILFAVLLWGGLMFFEFGAKILLKIFPRDLLIEYIDVVFYGSLFLVAVIGFRKTFWSAIKELIKKYEKYLAWTVVATFIAFVLMVASAIILDSFGIGDSSNQEAVDNIIEYGVLQLITVCVTGPVVEEVAYRGILFGILKGRGAVRNEEADSAIEIGGKDEDDRINRSVRGKVGNGTGRRSLIWRIIRGVAAVLLTAFVFAFSHVDFIDFSIIDMLANIPILMLGLTLTILYWKTDNILCPIIAHIIINSVASLG